MYKTITLWEPQIGTDEFREITENQILVLKEQGKTDGEKVITNPTPWQRVVERVWVDEVAAQEWLDWMEAEVWPKAKESKIEPI